MEKRQEKCQNLKKYQILTQNTISRLNRNQIIFLKIIDSQVLPSFLINSNNYNNNNKNYYKNY